MKPDGLIWVGSYSVQSDAIEWRKMKFGEALAVMVFENAFIRPIHPDHPELSPSEEFALVA